MGQNNRSRRDAKKRKKRAKAQRRGPRPEQQSPWSVATNEAGTVVDLKSPIEFIYYDEADFLVICPSCREVSGIPIHSMRMREGSENFELGLGPEGVSHVCSNCGHEVETPPRIESAPDGKTLYTIDRQTLLDAGLEEWASEMLTMTLRKDGVDFQVSVSGGSREVLVVCDDCGLPFTTRIAHHALTSSAEEPVELSMLAGPCDHCGGAGSVLTHRISDGGYVTVTSSPSFAESVLATLAEDLRKGRLGLGAVSEELRKRGGPYRALGEWLDTNPVNSIVASTVLSTIASLAVAQIPPVIDQNGEPVQQEEQKGPRQATFTEEEVGEIVTRILNHYDRTQRLKREPAPPRRRD